MRFSSLLFATSMLLFGALALLPKSARAEITGQVIIARNGQPEAIIVLPDVVGRTLDKTTQIMLTQAGMELADFLKRMTGAPFKVVRCAELGEVKIDGERVTSAKVPASSYILVGESDLTRQLKMTPQLQDGAMYIKSAGNVVALLGPADGTAFTGGAVYAVHHLLESLGVRYLWPGQLGLVLPKLRDIAVPYGTLTHTPLIRQRSMRMILSSSRSLEGAKDLGLDGDYQKVLISAGALEASYTVRGLGGWTEWQNLGGNAGITGGHAFFDTWTKYGKDHPGWFALQPDGTRQQHTADRACLCLSNSELIRQIADDINAQADANPALLSVPLGLNDGGTDAFCMCKVNALGEPGCITYDPPQGKKIHLWGWDKDYVSLTDRYMVFANRVAEKVAAKHPNLLLVVDAYSLYSNPPVVTKLHPNLVVRYVPSTMDDWEAWSSKASKIFWRPNTLSAPWREAALKLNSDWAKDLQFAAHHSTIATDFDAILNNWATEGLNYYLLARLNWDPDASVDDMVNDYCEKGFGVGAKEIREYFNKADSLTRERQALMLKLSLGDPANVAVHVRLDSLAALFTPKLKDELSGLLDAAGAKIAGHGPDDEAIRQRIAFLRIGLDWTDLQARSYRMLISFKRGQPVDLAAAGALLEKRRKIMREIFQNSPLAVNVAYVNYADRGYWEPLQKAVRDAAAVKPVGNGDKTMIDADEEGRPIVVPKT